MVDKRCGATFGFFTNDFLGLALGANEEDGALVRSQFAYELHRFLVHQHRGFEVDDVNLVPVPEDVRCHLGVPVTGLVAEMNAGFQHFAHGGGH